MILLSRQNYVNLSINKLTFDYAICIGSQEEKNLVENQTRMLEKLLNFLPVEEKYISAPPEAITAEDCRVPLRLPVVPVLDKSQHIDLVSIPEAIVIVNTQKFEKEMIVSRRSSYQKILALEKEGVQIVERDLSLPVDLIITSGICLMWYNCTEIHRKTSTSNEASSCLNLCIDNIATDVLTSLSLAFCGCVLVIFLLYEDYVYLFLLIMKRLFQVPSFHTFLTPPSIWLVRVK